MSKYEKAAIIGYYRNRATWLEVKLITGFDLLSIKIVVAKHLGTKVIYL